jgi:hypothetical protein
VSGHGSTGLTPVETPTEAPEKPEVPVTDEGGEFFGSGVGETHIGARSDSEEYDETWQGWIVNQRASVSVQGMGETIPLTILNYDEDGNVTMTKEQDEGYTGQFSNPSYIPSKAFPKEGFRVILPEVESAVRDATEVQSTSTYEVVIPEDDFVLSA